MSLTVVRLPDEPIIVATMTGTVDVEMIQEMFAQSAALAQDIEGKIYRIADYSNAQANFGELLKLVVEASKAVPGSSADPNIVPYMVGSDSLIRLAADFLRQERYGNLTMPIFKTLDDALTAARTQIAITKNQS